MTRVGLLVSAMMMMASVVHADVDWAKGLVTAEGIGVANREAPTPASARGPARRLAEDAAKGKLAREVGGLPIAGGGKLADKLGDTAVKAAVDHAVANAIAVTADPETDGSWRVVMAVPIEALRQAIGGGPRALLGGDDGPAVMVIEANAKPAIGYTIAKTSAATVFVKSVPAWVPKDAPRAKGKVKGRDIEASVGKATASTLFLVVI